MVIVASFQYDAFGRRIARTDASGVTTAYLYDGSDAVQEVSDGSARTSLVGQNIDERFARDDTTGRTYFLTDALGSTIALTDAAANVKQRYDYSPYGEVNLTGTAGLTNPYQYTGRENDGNGLYYYRARYYSPGAKRFISEDPLRETAGINSYAYAGGNPIAMTDPTGLLGFATLNALRRAPYRIPTEDAVRMSNNFSAIEATSSVTAAAAPIIATAVIEGAGPVCSALEEAAPKVVQACKNPLMAAILGSTICGNVAGTAKGSARTYVRDRERIQQIQEAVSRTLRRNTGSERTPPP